jgi:hypothetical protein
MDKPFFEKESMVRSVKDFLQEHQATIVGVIPAMAGMITQLNNLSLGLHDALVHTTSKLTGYAQDKKARRLKLIAETLAVGNALSVYYTAVVPDEVLQQRFTFRKSYFTNLSGSNLLVRAREVHETADPIKTQLAPYGVPAARVDGLKTIMDEFFGKFSSPQQRRDEVKAQRQRATALLKQSDELLKQQVDLMMGTLQAQHDTLYTQYKFLRRIVNSPVNKTLKRSTLLPGAVKFINYRKNFLQADTKITLHNDSARTKGNALHFYFAAKKNDKPKEGQQIIAVNPAEEKIMVTGESGFSNETPLLHVLNPGNAPVKWRARVGVEKEP